MSSPRAIHFAPTILPQGNSDFSNWHGIYERGQMKNIILLIYLQSISLICKCEKTHFYGVPMNHKRF